MPTAKNLVQQDNFDITELCVWAHISRAQLFKLWKSQQGPRRTKIGRRVIVTRQNAQHWIDSLQEKKSISTD